MSIKQFAEEYKKHGEEYLKEAAQQVYNEKSNLKRRVSELENILQESHESNIQVQKELQNQRDDANKKVKKLQSLLKKVYYLDFAIEPLHSYKEFWDKVIKDIGKVIPKNKKEEF